VFFNRGGCLQQSEIIPFEPDLGNASEGKRFATSNDRKPFPFGNGFLFGLQQHFRNEVT
jgi:hypothetical protein